MCLALVFLLTVIFDNNIGYGYDGCLFKFNSYCSCNYLQYGIDTAV